MKTKEEIKDSVQKGIQRISSYPDLQFDHSAFAKDHSFGEIAYYELQISELKKTHRKWNYPLTTCWIDQGCKKISDLSSEITDFILQYQERLKTDSQNWNAIDDFLTLYLQWENLNGLLTKCMQAENRVITYRPIDEVAIDKTKGQLHIYLDDLEKLFNVTNENKCNLTVFAAICHYVYNSKASALKNTNYIDRSNTSFEKFKKIMAECFGREVPSAGASKASKYYENLPYLQKSKLDRLFT